MAVFVYEDVVRLDVTNGVDLRRMRRLGNSEDEPMDKSKLVDSFDRQYTLRDVEPCNILGERVVLNQHGHQVTPGQELHD